MILITGSAGYIGSHICNTLLKKKIKFYSLDNLSGGNIQNVINKKNFNKIDFSSEKVLEILLKKKITTVIHTAAYTFPNESEINKKKYYINNIYKTKKFIDYCQKAKIKNFFFFSTSNIYTFNKNKFLAITENGKVKPKNYYGY